MAQIKQYVPTAQRPKKRPRGNINLPDNSAKRPRILSFTSNTMTAALPDHDLVDIRARLSPSARMDLALKVLDVGDLSILGLLLHRLASAKTRHFETAFLSEGGGLEKFLEELVTQFPAAEDCIFRAVGHDITLKRVSAEMELVKTYTLLSSTELTPHSMRDWSIGIPDHLTPHLASILRACAVSDRAMKENKIKKDTFTVRAASLAYYGQKDTI
jgi:hypothetical protein